MSYVDAAHANRKIYIWDRDESGNLTFNQYKAPYYLFVKNQKKGNYRGIYGDPLIRYDYESFWHLKQSREKYKESGYTVYESDISPIYKKLSEKYYNQSPDTPTYIGLYDIEVDFDLSEGKGFPSPDNPYGVINSISLYLTSEDLYYMFLLTDKSVQINDFKEGKQTHTLIFSREQDLLRSFEEKIQDVDILSGWNSSSFDDLYVFERVKRLYGESYALKFFSRNNFKAYIRETIDDYGNNIRILKPKGRNCIDLMDLYKQFTQNELMSYSLDNVSSVELNEGKIEYEGNLGDLYRNDPQKFFEYSFHDVYLLKKLHDKLQHLNLAVKMTRSSCVLFDDIFGSITLIEQAIYNYCYYEKDEPIILPDVKEQTKESLPGAFVYKTINGVHHWVSSSDLSALYPNTIRTLNISPETYIFQCLDRQNDHVKVVGRSDEIIQLKSVDTGEIFEVSGKELSDILIENQYSISANGSIFTNDFRGILPEVLDTWTRERNYYKGLMKEASDEIEEERYDNFQWIKKILNNSMYGILSNQYCRFYQIDLARSITLTGQIISSFQGRRADELVETLKDEV